MTWVKVRQRYCDKARMVNLDLVTDVEFAGEMPSMRGDDPQDCCMFSFHDGGGVCAIMSEAEMVELFGAVDAKA